VARIGGRISERGSVAAVLAVGLLALLVVAGCGGGGSSSDGGGKMSADEVVAKVEAGCVKDSAYSVWLPEHVQKEKLPIAQGRKEVEKAGDEYKAMLAALDPPDDLAEPIDALIAGPPKGPATKAGFKAYVRRFIALYEEIGATRCSRGLKASLLVIKGASVTAAFKQVGEPLPPRPPGW
jgi:hypothetical protein